jgi:hypothetical protein
MNPDLFKKQKVSNEYRNQLIKPKKNEKKAGLCLSTRALSE